MSKYHVNSNGEAGVCRAKNGGCPFGGESEHYDSAADAQVAAERILEAEHGTTATVQNMERKITKEDLDAAKDRLFLNSAYRVDTPWEEREQQIRKEIVRLHEEIRRPDNMPGSFLDAPLPSHRGVKLFFADRGGLTVEDSNGVRQSIEDAGDPLFYPALSQHLYHHPDAAAEIESLLGIEDERPIEWNVAMADITNRDAELDPVKTALELSPAFEEAEAKRRSEARWQYDNDPRIQAFYYD